MADSSRDSGAQPPADPTGTAGAAPKLSKFAQAEAAVKPEPTYNDAVRAPDVDPASRPTVPANSMPGGMAHTAGGSAADTAPTYIDVVKNLGPEYYLNFHKRPCVRDSQLVAIGAGAAFGSLAAILRKPVYLCTNYAVASWVIFGCGSYQYCQYQRSREKRGMMAAKTLMESKRARVEANKEARRRRREEEDRKEEEEKREAARRRSWKYWLDKNVKFW